MNLAQELRRNTEQAQREQADRIRGRNETNDEKDMVEAQDLIRRLPLLLKRESGKNLQPQMDVMQLRSNHIIGTEEDLLLAAEVDEDLIVSRLKGSAKMVADWLKEQGLGITVRSQNYSDEGQGRSWSQTLLVATW